MNRNSTRCRGVEAAIAAMRTTLALLCLTLNLQGAGSLKRKTEVRIIGDEFHINGQPTYQNRFWNGQKIQGLLLNSRMVQGIFDDRNPDTVRRWAYPDTGQWDAERNTREFLAAMPEWRKHGLLAFTINLQGGSPQGYSNEQPWHNSAIESDGSLRADYMERLERILNRADELGMAVILGVFYFGQDQRVQDEASVIRATENAANWLFDRGYRHVLMEINNECDVKSYDHAILQPDRIHELIERVKGIKRNGHRILVGTSYAGGSLPGARVVRASDFILIHGNGISDPERIAEMVRQTRTIAGYEKKPILFNEDDHFDFEKRKNNFHSAINEYASWGYFDPGKSDYMSGYQCPPINWGLNTDRKRAFFQRVSQITGSNEKSANATVRRINYNGWADSLLLSNGIVEAVVVPAIGRVMQFRFAGQNDGPFWENRALDGKAPDPKSTEWGNFGGDKTWPAPQGDWPAISNRGWPPPATFDSTPLEARIEGSLVVITSPIDSNYGIRAIRKIALPPNQPQMSIETIYEKIEGPPRKVSVWIITQLDDPEGVYAPVPKSTIFPAGYTEQSEMLPLGLKIKNGLLSLSRNPGASHKIGMDSGTLIWVGKETSLRIDSPRVPGSEYPDKGSSAEIYTNGDPLDYVELEMLGPLFTMQNGDRIASTCTYSLYHRTEAAPEKEARKLLND